MTSQFGLERVGEHARRLYKRSQLFDTSRTSATARRFATSQRDGGGSTGGSHLVWEVKASLDFCLPSKIHPLS